MSFLPSLFQHVDVQVLESPQKGHLRRNLSEVLMVIHLNQMIKGTTMTKMTMDRMTNVVAHVAKMVRFTEHFVDLQMRRVLS